MIAALWANSNYDSQEEGKEAPRKEAIANIEESFEAAIQVIITGINPDEEIEAEDTYGFFDAGKRGSERIQSRVPDGTEVSVQDVVDYSSYIDQ